MADTTFAQFTLEASPVVTDFLVGYRTAISGGERRYDLSSLNTLFQANITTGLTANRVLLAGASGALTASDLSYSTPTLSGPDGLIITGAGSIGLTAGGTNENITLTPSGTGDVVVTGADNTYVFIQSTVNTKAAGFRLGNAAATAVDWEVGVGGSSIGDISAKSLYYYDNAGGNYRLILGAKSKAAWGTRGAGFSLESLTFTDSSSSGTVATAVANSFAVPTFAASSATTFTNAANLYIAGDVAAGTNVSLGASYGLWNVGKTRLDGIANIGDSISGSDIATRPLNLIGTNAVARIWRVSADSTTASPAFELMHGTTNLSASRDVYWDVTADTTGMIFRDRQGAAILQRLLLSANAPVTIPAATASTWATTSAWGTSGIQFNITGGTSNDTSSSGTVATAVANSLGVPTFRSTSATTYTNAANLYIAGDVTNGTNVTLTNSYGLWNVGKTRLDGLVGIGAGFSSTTQLNLPASTTGVSTLRIPHGSAPSSPVNGDIWTTSSGLFVRINGVTVGPLS